MKCRSSEVRVAAIAIAIGFLTSSCNSKLDQCKNMIQVVNQTVTDTRNLTNTGTQGDPSIMEKLSERYAQAAKDMEGVNVSEEQLKTYQGQFATMYKSASQFTKQIGESIKSKKLTQVIQGNNQLQKLLSPEKDLANGISQYCQAGESKPQNTAPSPPTAK